METPCKFIILNKYIVFTMQTYKNLNIIIIIIIIIIVIIIHLINIKWTCNSI